MNNPTLKVILTCLVLAGAICSCREGLGGSFPQASLDCSFSSAEALTEEFLKDLKAGDLETLELIAVDREEFKRLFWPHLPASRPGTNLTPDFVWEQSQIRSLSSLRSTVSRYRDRDIRLIRIELSGEVRDYGEVRLFMEPEVVVSVEGTERKTRLFGPIMLLDGEYKIYCYSL